MNKIRLLMLAGTPGLYGNNSGYNGGGWIVSLEKELLEKHSEELELGLAWPTDTSSKDTLDDVDYYGIPQPKHIIIRTEDKEKKFCNDISYVIDDFKPDVILCFGTENGLALADTITDIPVLIHLQGILNPYFETWMPNRMTWKDYIANNPRNIIDYLHLKAQMKRELKTMQACKFFLGRTEWDKNISKLVSPNSKYFYCSEMLRPEIYNSKRIWEPNRDKGAIKIVSVISGPTYKGGDVVLRAANLLKQFGNQDFEWNIYGFNPSRLKLWERLTKINGKRVNVYAKGVIDAQTLVNTITEADVCVHPSYIENSPNTVCEMQVLGCPVIATDVGGTSTLVKNGETGVLVPANHPWTMAAQILNLAKDKETASRFGANARKVALERHNPDKIASDLLSAIRDTLNK